MTGTARVRAGVVGIVVLLAAAGCAGAGAGEDAATRTVELLVRHSRFVPDRLEVARGTTVRFVVRNDDPIDHEFIVGDDEVHRRHEEGTDAVHGAVPGEVSVRAGGLGETTLRFDVAGEVVFACHLPGHLAYGMDGIVVVT